MTIKQPDSLGGFNSPFFCLFLCLNTKIMERNKDGSDGKNKPKKTPGEARGRRRYFLKQKSSQELSELAKNGDSMAQQILDQRARARAKELDTERREMTNSYLEEVRKKREANTAEAAKRSQQAAEEREARDRATREAGREAVNKPSAGRGRPSRKDRRRRRRSFYNPYK